MRSARTAAMLVMALASFSPLRARAAGKRLTFEKYRGLDDAARSKLVRRYVRRSGAYWKVLLDSYLIHTDISAEGALALAVKMDEFYRGFRRIFAGPFRVRSRPELFALKDRASYSRAVTTWCRGYTSPPEWSMGMFAGYGGRYALFGCAVAGDEKLYSTLFHEGTHHLMHFYIGSEFPRWFDEGAATNFQSWDVSLSPERNVTEAIWRSGWPMYLHRMATGEPKPDLAGLMRTPVATWVSRTGDPSPLYAQAWGIVNCLLTSGRRGQKNINILIGAFRSGKGARKGARLLAPQAMAMLTREYDDYVSRVVIPHCEHGLPVAGLIAAGKDAEAAARLEEGLGAHPGNNELLYFKGLLALKAGDAREALAILKPLDRRYPRHPRLTSALGRAALKAGDRMAARRWLRKALRENIRDEEAKDLLDQMKPTLRR